MKPALLWVTRTVLGMAAATVTGILGVGAGAIALVLTVPLIVRGDHLVAISGILVGFGGLWLAALDGQLASGGGLDGAPQWVLVGAVPLVVGVLALGVRLARSTSTSRDVDGRGGRLRG